MSEWKRYKLSDLYEMSSGISSTKEQAGHGSPFLSFSIVFNNYFLPDSLIDLMDTTDGDKQKYSINEGDIFLTRTSETVDELAMSSVALKDYPEASFSGFLKRLRPVDKRIAYPKFMAFYLRSPLFRRTIINNTVMTLRASFNEAMFSYLEIMLPDFDTQKKIGDFLYSLEKKKQTNNQINQELEAMAKTLYDYWFVQFDFPDQNGKPYKSSGGKMVYNPELKREIPEGWGVETLVDNTLSKVIKPGIDHFTQKTYLATGDVVNTSIKDGRLITFENRETRANMQPSVNSVWFAKMKSSNKHLFLSHSMKELVDSTILSTGFMGLQCKEESFEYIASFISDPNFEIFKDTLSHGATQEAVNIDDLRSVPVIIPDDYILREFHRIAKSIFLNLGRNMIEDKTLSSLRDWLLPMLMNGQVKVE